MLSSFIAHPVLICGLVSGACVVTKLLIQVLSACFILVIIFPYVGRGVTFPSVQGDSSTILYFHNRSEKYRNENMSITVYDGADGEPPLGTEVTAIVKCQITQHVQYSFFPVTFYLGFVSWITQPLSDDYAIDGTITRYVWMSSGDVNTPASGYALAVADLDENDNVAGGPFYNYYYNAGKVLSAEPTEYSLTISISHVFPKDHKLAFQTVVGTTAQGWTANVHFDSADRNSRVVLPGSPAVIPEFGKEAVTLILVVTAAVGFFVVRCGRRNEPI